MNKKPFISARTIAFFSILLALVVVFQTISGLIVIGGTALNFVLVPIVLGGILLGVTAGSLLGVACGIVTLVCGVTGFDPFTNFLFLDQPVLTALTCIVKATAAGFVSALAYKLIAKKSQIAGVIVASALAPIINTGLFIVGALTMRGTIETLFATDVANGVSFVYLLFIMIIGLNFPIELGISLVLSPAISRVVRVVEKRLERKKRNKKAIVPVQEEQLNEIVVEVPLLEGQEALPLQEIQEETPQKTLNEDEL